MKCGRTIKSAFELTKRDLALSSRMKPAEKDHISSEAAIEQKRQLEEVSQREWDDKFLKPVPNPAGFRRFSTRVAAARSIFAKGAPHVFCCLMEQDHESLAGTISRSAAFVTKGYGILRI